MSEPNEADRERYEGKQPIPHFICPACGGEYFGRNTAADTHGKIVCLETVRCHDQYEVGCAWHGAWPGKRYEKQMSRRMTRIVSQVDELTKRAELAEAAAAKANDELHRLRVFRQAVLAACDPDAEAVRDA